MRAILSIKDAQKPYGVWELTEKLASGIQSALPNVRSHLAATLVVAPNPTTLSTLRSTLCRLTLSALTLRHSPPLTLWPICHRSTLSPLTH